MSNHNIYRDIKKSVSNLQYDVVIPYGGKALSIAIQAVRNIEKFCPYQKLYIVTDKKNFWHFKYLGVRDLIILDEDALIPGVTCENIQDYLHQNGAWPRKFGWYFQQFIKMAMCLYDNISEYYLIWDSDTIMLRPIRFFTDDEKIILAKETEYHYPYFETYERLLDLPKTVEHSFITQYMMVKSSFMRELIERIKENAFLTGKWVWKIMETINVKHLDLGGFSEYETYGNFVSTFYSDSVISRHIPLLRNASKMFALYPNKYDLYRLSHRYACAAFERRGWNPVRVKVEKLISRIYYEFQKLKCPSNFPRLYSK